MSHYCCKRCGLRYDDCTCSAPNAQLPKTSNLPPQDGKHWDPESRSISAKCLNCRRQYPEHLFNNNVPEDRLACPDPSQITTGHLKKLDEGRIRELVREYWGTQVKVLEDAYVSFVRRIEKEIRDTSS